MTEGIIINGTDTKTTYGLIMLDDYTVSAPTLKDAYVDLPGISGSLDFSTALTGYPLYEDREIALTLFKRCGMTELTTLRETLFANFNGYTVKVATPDKAGYHWRGRFFVGELPTYNGGLIPITMRAQPYRLKDTVTTVTQSLAANTDVSVTLANAGMPTIPTFRCTRACTLTDADGNTYSLSQNTDFTSADLTLTGTGTTVTARVSQNGTLTVTYQEGTL